MDEPGPPRPPAFFLSYAREDDESGAVERLYQDLRGQLKVVLGPAYGEGFRDRTQIKPGAAWSAELQEALETARSFVAVLSRTYFSRPYCGKEWAAFSRRLAPHLDEPGVGFLMQPVLLVGKSHLDPIPTVIQAKQYDYDGYPEEYARRGLIHLQSLVNEGDLYRRFLLELTDLIATAVTSVPVAPMSLPPIAEIQSAWHDQTTGVQIVPENAAPGSHLFAQFVYVAARTEELTGLREERLAYGELGGLDWQPFRPPVEDEIGIIAQAITAREKFRYDRVEIGDDLAERLSAATEENKIVVVVVDPWTVRLESYRRLMRDLDRHNLPTCVVIIPFNDTDAETVRDREVLRSVIEATFVNRNLVPDLETFIVGVASKDDLEAKLSTALASAKSRVLRRYQIGVAADPQRRFPGPPSVSNVPDQS
ncbi:FxsC protein [Nocardioides ganghwensis]|uniref:TIR domain-containing protein n=1 Tax=Nocardioides ganghwensis TaxID=252230 RepID=A0A4V1RMT7_9ACTN|nr:FxsC protein [Nocardioides ganghwensis]MBD3946161.1 TIR domain-containing protein [Nocardioides ganghwensis]RYC03497.1 TIR domain-containing protein [Nocardioides ganghwensis]